MVETDAEYRVKRKRQRGGCENVDRSKRTRTRGRGGAGSGLRMGIAQGYTCQGCPSERLRPEVRRSGGDCSSCEVVGGESGDRK